MSYTIKKEVKQQAVKVFLMDEDATIEEVALIFGISRSTLSRALAEEGHVSLRRWKTDRENAIMDYLATLGITTLDELKQHI